MKRKTMYFIYPLLFIAMFSILVTACKKDEEEETPPPTSVTDADGNVYNTVVIGTQVWLKENLKTTKYRNGTAIPLVTDQSEWGGLTTPAVCWYENSQTNYGNTYGAIYNWYAVKTGNICPTGWHVPTDAEWTTLVNFLGGENVAGGKMKETGTTHWNMPNTGATNESGFTALPGGYRFTDGGFYDVANFGYWWSASEFNAADGFFRLIYFDDRVVEKGNFSKKYGFSVRCLMD